MEQSPLQLVYDNSEERLDKWLSANVANLSRNQAQHLIKTGQVSAEGYTLKPNSVLPVGTHLSVNLPSPPDESLKPENMALEVIYQDDHLIGLNKPAGLVVHPSVGHLKQTLVNALLYHYPEIAPLHPERPGIVHRLDKDTSGVLVIARTAEALQNLQAQFKARTIQKTYLALVRGQPQPPTGIIDVPIGRHPQLRQRMAPLPDGKPARTHYQILETFSEYSLLEIELETGRTHQIRVHLAWLGYPVVGDSVYARKKPPSPLTRQFLHAARLVLRHPYHQTPLTLKAPLPSDLQNLLASIR